MRATTRDRYSLRRVGVIGGLVLLAVATGMFIWRTVGPQPTAPSADGIALLPVDAARTVRDMTPAAALSPARPADPAMNTGDEAALCARTLSDAQQFALQEQAAAEPAAPPGRDEQWWRTEVDNLQRRAAGSRDPEIFLASVLLDTPERRVSEDAVARSAMLELGVRASGAGSPLLAWHALRACVEAGASCPYEHSVPSLFEADRQNAESWALLATFRYRRGDVAGALAAMQGAARAPTSSWYWAQTITLVERSLDAATQESLPERMATAFGTGASVALPSQSALLQMCRTESASSRAWGEACLAFGALRGQRADTVAARLFAYSMREQAATALGDTGLAKDVAVERALFEASRIGGRLALPGDLHTALIMSDPARGRAYLDAIEQSGEIEGSRLFFSQQLPLLLQRAGLLEREGARECMAQFVVPRAPLGTRAATASHQLQVADEFLVSVRGGQTLATMVSVRPDGTFMMPLSAAAATGRTTAEELERRITASGRSTRPLQQEIVALGKTTEQLQQEIATLLARGERIPEVQVILLAPQSREDLRLQFDSALQEAAH